MASKKQRKLKKAANRQARMIKKAQRKSVSPDIVSAIDDAKSEIGMSVDQVLQAAADSRNSVASATVAADVVTQAVKDYVENMPEETTSPAQTVKAAPTRPSGFMRGMNTILNKVSKAREIVFGSKVATEVDKELRKQYMKVVQQAILTQELLKDNNVLLQEKSKEDVNLAAVLQEVATNTDLKKIFEKTASGQELYGRELVQATEFMERITATLEQSGVSLELNLPKAIDSMSKFVKDTSLDITSRREAFEDLQKSIKSLKIKSDGVEELMKIESDRLNFTEDENQKISGVIAKLQDEIAKGNIKDAKLTGTVRDLNKTLGSVVLTNGELTEFLETQSEGKSVRDKLADGFGAVGGGVKRGIFGALAGAAGLPGLDLLIEDVLDLTDGMGSIGKGLKKIPGLGKLGGLLGKIPGVGKVGGMLGGIMTSVPSAASGNILGAGAEAAAGIGGKAGGLLSKAGGVGGLLKGGGRILGKAALPLAVAMSAFEFGKGFMNADSISGKKKEDLSVGDKIQAGVSSVLEGLSFGLVSVQDAFKFIDSAMSTVSTFFTDLKNGVVSLAKKITGMFDFTAFKEGLIKGFESLMGEDGFLTKVKMVIDKVLEFLEYTPIGLLFKGAQMAGEAAANFMAPQPAAAGGVPMRAMAVNAPATVNDQAFGMSAKQDAEQKAMARKSSENSGKQQTVVVQSPAPQQSRGPSRSIGVEDMGLAMLNSGMMDK